MIVPKVSVIMPVYNSQRYLDICIQSILNQTLQDFELICVDDGSQDESVSIINQYAAKDSRVKVLTQKNQGAGIARNKGLENAMGEYLSFLDSDDFFEPTMLEKAYKKAKSTKAEIIAFGSKRYWDIENRYEDTPWVLRIKQFPNKEVFAFSEIENSIFTAVVGYPWNKLFKRQFIIDNEIKFQDVPVLNDTYFVYAAFMLAKRITLINEALVYQRKSTGGSITDNRAKNWHYVYVVLEGLKAFMKNHNLYDKYEQHFINYVLHISLVVFNELQDKKAKRNMYNALKTKWFVNFELLEKKKEYFIDENKYNQFRTIIEQDEIEYICDECCEKNIYKDELQQLKKEIELIYKSKSYKIALKINRIYSLIKR